MGGQAGLDKQPIPGMGGPPWRRERTWKCFPDLLGRSTKVAGDQALLQDTIDTIRTCHSYCDTIIYTDGSAREGLYDGGSAAVVTTGPPEDPTTTTTLHRRGRPVTCSYETELTAL